jgi:hypothetical protein
LVDRLKGEYAMGKKQKKGQEFGRSGGEDRKQNFGFDRIEIGRE